MFAMGRKQPSALASYQIPRASTITSLPQILFPICHPTFSVTGARPPNFARHGASSRVRVDWAVRDQPHFAPAPPNPAFSCSNLDKSSPAFRSRKYPHRYHEQAASVILKILGVGARGPQHPGPDRNDQSGDLGEPDEFRWKRQSERRVLPTDERLHTRDPARTNFDYGLIVHNKFIPLQ